jgi:hypothetical protein
VTHITLRRVLLVEGIIFVLFMIGSFVFVLLLPPRPCGTEEACARSGGLFFLWVLTVFVPAAAVVLGVARTQGKLSRFSITLLVIVHLFVIYGVASVFVGRGFGI